MSIREVGARLVLDIKDAEAKIKQLEKEIEKIEKTKIKIDANNAQLEQLKKRLEEIKEEKSSLEKQKLTLQADLNSLNQFRNQLKQVTTEINNLKSQLDTLNNKKINIQTKLNTNQQAINKVLNDGRLSDTTRSNRVSSLQNERRSLQNEKLSIENTINSIKKQLNELDKKKITLNADISKLENAEKAVKEIDNAIADLDNEKIKIDAQTDKIEDANKKLDETVAKEEEVRDTKAEIQTEVNGYTEAKSQLDSLQSTVNALRSMSRITFSVGSTISSLGDSMLNVNKLFSNNIIGDIGRFFVQGIGYSSLYRLTSNLQNSIAESLSGGIERYDTINVSKRTLGVILSDVEDADAQINNMITDLDSRIEGLPTTLDEALSHISTFTSINKDITHSEKLFNALNDAILTFGGTSDQVDSAVTQYSQIMGSKMDARTLLSLQDAGMTPVLTAVAQEMGMTYAEFREAFTGTDPTISLEEFEEALIKLDEEGGGGLEALQTMAKKSVQTITNALSLIQIRMTKAVGSVVDALDDVITEITGKSIYENVYEFTDKIIQKGNEAAQWVRDHKTEIGEALQYVKDKISDLWGIIKQFKFSEFIEGLKEGFEPLKKLLYDDMKPIFEKVKEYIKNLGDGSYSKGIGKFIGQWYTTAVKLKIVGNMLKIASKGFSVFASVLEVLSPLLVKGLPKITSKLSGLKNLFKGTNAIENASSSASTFNVESFKTKLSNLAIIAGGAGTIILYAKALKDINKALPDDLSKIPSKLTTLFATMGIMTLFTDIQGAASSSLGNLSVLEGAASLVGEGGAMWLFAKAIGELDDCIPDGIGNLQEKIGALIECIVAMSAITFVQGGVGLVTEGISAIAQAIGIIINLGLATDLITFAKAIKAIDENVPTDTKDIKTKINRLKEIVAMFSDDGDDTIGGAFKKLNEHITDWYKESHINKTTSMINSLASITDALTSIQNIQVDTETLKASLENIKTAVNTVMGITFSDEDESGNKKSTLSDSQYAKIAGVIQKFIVIATNVKNFQDTVSGLDTDAIKAGVTKLQDFLNTAATLTVDDKLKDTATTIQNVSQALEQAAQALETLKDSFYSIGHSYAENLIEGWNDLGIAGNMKSTITKAKSKLSDKSFKSVGRSYASSLCEGFSNGLDSLGSVISNKITTLYSYGDSFYNLGRTFGTRFSNGFNTTKTTGTSSSDSSGHTNYVDVQFAKGGPVYLEKGGTPLMFKPKGTDTIPAMLSPGEFVIRRKAVDKVGVDFLNSINNMDLRGAFHALTSQYGSNVSNIVNKNVTINNVTNNTNKQITFSENNVRRQSLKANRFMRGLA